jgi:hypothetical protein
MVFHSNRILVKHMELSHAHLFSFITTHQVILPMLIHIRLVPSVQRRPLGLILKQPHCLDIILTVRCEPVINPCRQNNQIVFLQSDAHPIILLRAHIEETLSVKDVTYLFVFVEVLVEEHLNLFFIHGAHFVRADDDLISVLVGAVLGDLVKI